MDAPRYTNMFHVKQFCGSGSRGLPIGTTCGRGLPMLKEIQGRTNDFLLALDGKLLPCGAFTYLMREAEGIASYKITQETRTLTRLQLVRPDGLPAELRTRLSQGFKQRLGDAVEIDIELVDSIPAQGNGKYRYVVSHVTGQMPSSECRDA